MAVKRRGLLVGLCALGAGVPRVGASQSGPGPVESDLPQENDRLIFAYGDRAGRIMQPGDLDIGARQVFAFSKDPVNGKVRDGRLNQIVVVRLNPDWLGETTKARSADGIVAYSGVCTHAGCDIDIWVETENRLQCMCHESQFDPADAARVVGGPAPSPLAALPLKVVDGQLAVAGSFEGRVGFQQQGGLDPFGL